MTHTDALAPFAVVVAFVLYVRVCHYIARRHPGSLADRIRAAIADEETRS